MGRDTAATSVAHVATVAHRAAQGGRGSGYDVWASALGGTIVFTGGRAPRAEQVQLPWLENLALFPGPDQVRTPGAVGRYRAWKERNPAAAAEFVRESNEAVLRLASAHDFSEAAAALEVCREIGLALGDAIGVSARLAPPDVRSHEAWKAVGAGNELGVGLLNEYDVPSDDGDGSTDPDGSRRMVYRVSREGLTWA
jgi:phosphomevalonate kinase